MAGKKKVEYEKQLFLVLVLGLLAFVILVIRPVFTGLLGGIILAYLFMPVYRFVLKGIKHRTTAALLTTFFIIMLVVIPIGFIGNSVVRESSTLVGYSRSIGQTNYADLCEPEESAKCQVSNWISSFTSDSSLGEFIKGFFSQLSKETGRIVSDFLTSLPWKFLILFVVFFCTFIFLKDGKHIFEQIKTVLPIKPDHRDRFVKKFKDVTHGVVYGTIFVALVQAILAMIGFWIFGVKTPFFWGFVVFIISILPFVAPPLVYVPIGAFKIVNGLFITQNGGMIFNGIAILLWGTLIVSLVDNLIRYKITGSKGNVHPLIVLLGILGGIKVFGIVGLFFGPMVLVFALTFLEIYFQK